jgi:transposase
LLASSGARRRRCASGYGRPQRDSGTRAGLTTAERDRLKEQEREIRELKRANEILRLASAYFAQAELDRRHK